MTVLVLIAAVFCAAISAGMWYGRHEADSHTAAVIAAVLSAAVAIYLLAWSTHQ